MDELKVQSLIFSPTGSTKKIVYTIEAATGLPRLESIDLTHPREREAFTGRVEGDLLIVGSPVYEGSLPWPIVEPLKQLNGKGKYAIPVAVYGNRSAETCVDEMAKLLRMDGFKVPAAASFVAQHSFSNPNRPIAVGRPDEHDLEVARQFGEQIRGKLSTDPSEVKTSELLNNHLAWGDKMFDVYHPDKYQVAEFPEGYHRRVAANFKKLIRMEFSKTAECTNCGKCVEVCPTDAIRFDKREIDDGLCISCTACMRVCPVRIIMPHRDESPATREVFESLGKIFAARKEPSILI